MTFIIGISFSIAISSSLYGQGQNLLAVEDISLLTDHVDRPTLALQKHFISEEDYDGPHQKMDVFYLPLEAAIKVELISEGASSLGTYQIIDAQGKIVEEKEIHLPTGKSNITTVISNYAPGQYSFLVIAPEFSLVSRFRVR